MDSKLLKKKVNKFNSHNNSFKIKFVFFNILHNHRHLSQTPPKDHCSFSSLLDKINQQILVRPNLYQLLESSPLSHHQTDSHLIITFISEPPT